MLKSWVTVTFHVRLSRWTRKQCDVTSRMWRVKGFSSFGQGEEGTLGNLYTVTTMVTFLGSLIPQRHLLLQNKTPWSSAVTQQDPSPLSYTERNNHPHRLRLINCEKRWEYTNGVKEKNCCLPFLSDSSASPGSPPTMRSIPASTLRPLAATPTWMHHDFGNSSSKTHWSLYVWYWGQCLEAVSRATQTLVCSVNVDKLLLSTGKARHWHPFSW